MKPVIINRFDGGLTNDPRDRTSNVVKALTNFDAFSNVHKLTPFRDSENGDSSSATNLITSFSMAKTSGTSPADVYNLYGLGSTSNKAKIYYKDLATALGNATWTSTSNNVSAAGTVSPNLFVHYSRSNSGSAVNNSGIIFGAKAVGGAGSTIWGYDPTGLTAFEEDWPLNVGAVASPTMYRVAQGLVHSKDDVLYIPYDNKIMSNDNDTWTVAALTLPSFGYIPCISEYRDFLAVALAPLAGVGPNYVYLWGRDASTATTAEKIYWGEEQLAFIEELEGMLVGVSIANTSLRHNNRLVFRVYDGYSARKVLEITAPLNGSSSSITIDGNATAKQKINNRFFFSATITIDGVARKGVWSFGRNPSGQWTLIHERTPNNDSASTTGTTGFIYVSDYLFQVYDTAMSKTNDQLSYTATSILETVVNPNMDPRDMSRLKQLVGASLSFEKFPSGGTAVVKYRVDATTAWSSATTVISYSTAGDYIVEQTKDNAGTEFTAGREYEFRIESTGGVEITELKYTYENLESILPA